MAGGTAGSALCSVTEPMLWGRRLQVLIVMPWPRMRMRPWSMTNAGRQCIWISGDTTSLLERTNMPASHTDAVTGPVLVQHVLHAGGECLEGPVGLVVADRGGFGG